MAKGYKTNDERKAYAESHSDYVEACDRLLSAETVKKWFEDKHDWFLTAHYFTKNRINSDTALQNSSGFSETSGVTESGDFINKKDIGEKSW